MQRFVRSLILAVITVAVGVWLVRQSSHGPTVIKPATTTSLPSAAPGAGAGAAATNTPPATATHRAAHPSKGFKNPERLAEHFAKHGAEFGVPDADAYLALAQALRDAPVGGDVMEIVRPSDGVVSRFDRQSGAFLAFDRDGTIRTFFKPNDGEAYFRRQAGRSPRS